MRRRGFLALVLLLLLLVGGGGALVLLGVDPARESAEPVAEAADEPATDARAVRHRVHVADLVGTESTDGNPRTEAASLDVGDDRAREGAAETESVTPEIVVPEGGRRLGGRVVDAASGKPVSGVRVLFAAFDGEQSMGWYGDTTSEDGSFEHDVPTYWAERGTRFELRIGRRGYEDVILPVTDAEESVAIELHPLPHLPVPGKVVVHATHPDGTPITGVVLVGGSDGLDGLWQWAMADEAGRFELDGVLPGHWRLRLNREGREVEAILPDGGETAVHLVGPTTPWPAPLNEEEFRHLHAEISSRRPADITTDALVTDEEARDAASFQLAWEMQELETRWRAVAPRREVIVSGLAVDGPAWLRARASGPNNVWRVPIVDGSARFAGLTYEHWDLRIETAEGPGTRYALDLMEGEGPFRLDLAE